MEMSSSESLFIFIADLVWGPHTVLLLLGVGFYLTLRLRFLQLRSFRLSLRFLLGKKGFGDSEEDRRGEISPYQALTTSLAATIGNGNIAGVCTAITMGGPGAIFWMWLCALFGMATKIVEAVLGQKFKQTAADGTIAGGPMYYITHGLKLPWLAGIFAFFMGGKAMISTTIVQSNSIALALNAELGLDFWISGLGLAVLVWLVIVRGIKSIARITVFLSPFMAFIYIFGAFYCLAVFAPQIPHALSLIFVGAFNPSAVTGGAAGITVAHAIRHGLAKGAYSNEAGTGTAAVFHAAARTGEPVRQGLIASLDVFIDTIVICSLTALTVLVTGAWTGGGTSTEMAVNAFNAALPGIGGLIVVGSSFLFGYSSLIANPYYGIISYTYLFGTWIKKPFPWVFCTLIFIGSVVEVKVAWSIGDIFNGMMVFTNMIGVLALSGLAVVSVKAYLEKMGFTAGSTISAPRR